MFLWFIRFPGFTEITEFNESSASFRKTPKCVTSYVTAIRNLDLNEDLVFKNGYQKLRETDIRKLAWRQITIMAPSALLIVHCDYGLFQ